MVKLSQATINWNSQDMIRIPKQWGHDFQVNIYVMDIALILCDVCVKVMVL